MEDLFEGIPSLQRGKKGFRQEVPLSNLKGEGKVLGLYFSANWCPPCRAFTPKLSDWYNKLTTTVANEGKLEIVFISSDREEKDFDIHFDTMPWLGLPYCYPEIKAKLVRKYKITGVPSLVLLNVSNCSVISRDGRSVVINDPNGERFPWEPETFTRCMSGVFITSAGSEACSWGELTERFSIVGLFFSAQWCQPCQSFTFQLIKFYEKLKFRNSSLFEVVYVSSDNDETVFEHHLASMPWLALPFKDERSKNLKQILDVHSIPTLVLIDSKKDEVITTNARTMVTVDPEGHDFPWYPKALDVLHEGVVNIVNDYPSLVWFTDGSPEQIEEAIRTLSPIANDYFKSYSTAAPSSPLSSSSCSSSSLSDQMKRIYFFYTNDSELASSLRDEVLRVPEIFPSLVLVDIPNQRKYVCEYSDKLSSEILTKFLTRYRDKELFGTELS